MFSSYGNEPTPCVITSITPNVVEIKENTFITSLSALSGCDKALTLYKRIPTMTLDTVVTEMKISSTPEQVASLLATASVSRDCVDTTIQRIIATLIEHWNEPNTSETEALKIFNIC